MNPSSPSLALSKKSVDDIWPVTGKRVIVRTDFNVQVRGNVMENDFHIRCAIPTIRKVIEQGGICILLSHRGRPKGVTMTEAEEYLARQQKHLSMIHQGRTAYFASLSKEEKLMILSWTEASNMVVEHSAVDSAGDSLIETFASLEDREKTILLNRFVAEYVGEASRPPGYEADQSLYVVALRLAELLDQNVFFVHDCMHAREEIRKRRCGEVVLLENVRFYKEESSPDPKERARFAKILASYGDIFISDAFGIAHRDAATMTGIPRIIGHSAAGYWMQREISFFSKALRRPTSPLTAIVGGAKASDKIALLENLLSVIDFLCIGGGLGVTFLKALGFTTGDTPCEDNCVAAAQQLIEHAKARKVEIFLPIDHLCHTSLAETDTPLTTTDGNIPEGYRGLDIGPKTLTLFSKIVRGSKMCIWNGPMGVFEMPCYSNGTFGIAKALGEGSASRGAVTVVAGGDSARAAELSGHAPRISHVSTGGGASLELLEGKILPGVSILDDQE